MGVRERAIELATEAVRESGEVIAELARRAGAASIDGKAAILQEAVLGSEMALIGKIKAAFPDHNIFSEELGKNHGDSEYLWVIDPLDGTVNFSRGINEFVISVGLEHRGELVGGVIFDPVSGHLWSSEKGKGATCDSLQIHVSTVAEPSQMVLATDNSLKPEARRKNFDALAAICNEVRHIRILGSGALQLARAAAGSVDAYYKSNFNYWDYAASIIMVKEAGGVVTDFDGKPLDGNSNSIIASNGKAHDKLVTLLNKTG